MQNKFDISDLSCHELSELISQAQYLQNKKYKERGKQQITLNSHYVGKCYRKKASSPWLFGEKDYYIYIKVISAYASSEYRLSTLQFPESPQYTYRTFDYGANLFGDFDFDFFTIDSVMIKDLSSWEQIPFTLYENAFDIFCNKLKNLDFNVKENKNA